MQAALLKAIEAGELAAAQAAVQQGADLKKPGGFQRTPLHAVAKGAEPKLIEWLIENGAPLDARDGDGRTPLHLANDVSAEVLLRHRANITLVDFKGNHALHVAAEENGRMCRLLVEAGAPVDVRNVAGLTPLHCAVLQCKQTIAALLLDLGADINAKTHADYSHKWSYIAWDVQGMEQLVPAGATPLSLARELHRKDRWRGGRRFADLGDFLASRGGIEPIVWHPWRWVFGGALLLAIVWWFLKSHD